MEAQVITTVKSGWRQGGREAAGARIWTQTQNRRDGWSGPQACNFLDLRPLTCVHSSAQPTGSPWPWDGACKISSGNKEIKSALIKSHAGTGGPERPRHLPAALIVHS